MGYVFFADLSPFWISDQATGLVTLYDGAGKIIPLVVTIPKIGVPSGATGQVFNGTTDFNLPDGMPAHFLFDTLDSQILGCKVGSPAVNVATTPEAIYTGMAIGNAGGANYLYAADNTGLVWVFDKNFKDVTFTTSAGKFVDPDAFLGTLKGRNGMPIDKPFLWALNFRTGGPNTNTFSLYFTAGYHNQMDGRFGEIAAATPEPGTITLLLAAARSVGARKLWRKMRG